MTSRSGDFVQVIEEVREKAERKEVKSILKKLGVKAGKLDFRKQRVCASAWVPSNLKASKQKLRETAGKVVNYGLIYTENK